MSDDYKDLDKREDSNTEEPKEKDDHRQYGVPHIAHREEDLLSLLLKSSHFLHHRRGGRRGQGKILKILAQSPQISQKELQEQLGIESGSMSELVIKLEHKGLITREKDEADKRMTTLRITDLGLELSKELETEAYGEAQLLWSGLSIEEQEQLKQLLSKLLIGWENSQEVFHGEKRHRGCGHHDHHDCHHGHHKVSGHHKDHDHVGHHSNHGKEEHREHHGYYSLHGHHSRHDRSKNDHSDHHKH